MAKVIDSYKLRILKIGEVLECSVRYTIKDDVLTDLTKEGRFNFTITPGNTVIAEFIAIKNEIKTIEGIE